MKASSVNPNHLPVMLESAVHALIQEEAGVYIDATYGRGGHCDAILKRLPGGAQVVAFDRDREAIASAPQAHLDDPRLTLIRARFSEIEIELQRCFGNLRVNGIIADLGVSSPQLDCPQRGFSFVHDGPLDMRMDQDFGSPASHWLAQVSESALAEVLRTCGEERYARRIARRVVTARMHSPIRTTRQLADLVCASVPRREPGKHPATRTFLALRININQELQELKKFLPQCVELLKCGGRLVVITFHSLEDRIVKRFMREASIGAPGPQAVPFRSQDFRPTLQIIGRPQRPSASEITSNSRSRSAIMRVAERIDGASYA